MNKKRRSIDGLTIRDTVAVRPSVGFSDDNKTRQLSELGISGVNKQTVSKSEIKNKPKKDSVSEVPEKQAIKHTKLGEPNKKIESFLNEVKDEDPTNLVPSGDAKKKPRKKRRGVRWAVLGAIVLVVGLIIWKGIDIWSVLDGALADMTGGGVGIGDIIGADPTVPLKADANGRTNILVFGTSGYNMDATDEHDGQQLADSIMVVSLNQDEGDIKTVSIPRDLVSEQGCTRTAKMNETYMCEYNKYLQDSRYNEVKDDPGRLAELRWEYEKRAGEKFSEIVGGITGLEVQYWAHLNWGALIGIVDAIGGIDLAIRYQDTEYTGELPVIWTTDQRGIQDRNWDWACKNSCYHVKYSNGEDVHLDGIHAIALARARGESQPAYGTNGNWSREKNQQAILGAIVAKAKQTNFVTDLDAALNIIRALGDNLRMSFDAEGIRRGIYLAGEMGEVNMQSIDISPLMRTGMLPVPGVNSYECGGPSPGCLSYVFPRAGTHDYRDIADFIAKNLVRNLVEEEGAVVDVLNGTSATGIAAKISQELRNEGFIVGEVGNTPEEKEYAKTVIYRVGEGTKPATEKKLLEKFGVSKVKTGALPEGIVSTANFVVIVGLDN